MYSPNVELGGMIAFLEEGNFQKLKSVLLDQLPQYSVGNYLVDISSYYNHDYVYKTSHVRKSNKDIKLIHILLDFS